MAKPAVFIDNSMLWSLFKSLDQFELNYAYSGQFNTDITDRIMMLAETNMDAVNEPSKVKKRVYFIMMEALQNITRHQGNNELHNTMSGFFSIHKYNPGYLVTSGNTVETSKVNELRQKLEKVNAMDLDKLKEYYNEIMRTGGFSEKGGAGLGLIEMARKSGNKLAYDFEELNANLSYFYFQTNVTNGLSENNISSPGGNNLTIVQNIHKMVTENNLTLLYQGHFGHENLKSLMPMAEGDISEKQNRQFKKVSVSVMIELLQNISYHGSGRDENEKEPPGIFLVSDDDNVRTMTVGNFIKKGETAGFEKYVEKLNALDEAGLNELFREIIMREDKEGVITAGLGLIEVRFKTKNKIKIAILPYSDNVSFVITQATINH